MVRAAGTPERFVSKLGANAARILSEGADDGSPNPLARANAVTPDGRGSLGRRGSSGDEGAPLISVDPAARTFHVAHFAQALPRGHAFRF